MKVLVVLALVVFTGCNANIFHADAPKPQLEVLTEAFWDYVSKASQGADDTIQMIKDSHVGQQVKEHLTDTAQRVHDQLQQVARGAFSTLTKETSDLTGRLEEEMTAFREKLMPLTEDMKVKIQEQVEKLKQEMASYGDSVETLEQKMEELKLSLGQNMRELQTELSPHYDNMKQKVDEHLQDFKERIAPVTDQAQKKLTQKAQQWRDLVAPYVEEIREKMDLTALYKY